MKARGGGKQHGNAAAERWQPRPPWRSTLVQQVGDVLRQQVNVLRAQANVPLLIAVCAGAAAPAACNPARAARTRHGRKWPLDSPNSSCARVCQHAGVARAGGRYRCSAQGEKGPAGIQRRQASTEAGVLGVGASLYRRGGEIWERKWAQQIEEKRTLLPLIPCVGQSTGMQMT